jgi:hypothetical protein
MQIRKLTNDTTFEHRHIIDVLRIRSVLLSNGYEADLEMCAYIWDEESECYAAGWIGLPEDDEDLWGDLEYRIKVLKLCIV